MALAAVSTLPLKCTIAHACGDVLCRRHTACSGERLAQAISRILSFKFVFHIPADGETPALPCTGIDYSYRIIF